MYILPFNSIKEHRFLMINSRTLVNSAESAVTAGGGVLIWKQLAVFNDGSNM